MNNWNIWASPLQWSGNIKKCGFFFTQKDSKHMCELNFVVSSITMYPHPFEWTICNVCCGTYCIKLQLDIKLWKGQSTGYVNNQSWKVQFRAKNPLVSKQLIERNNYWCFELHAHLNPKWQFFFMIHLKFFIHVICLLCTCSFKFEYNCYIMMSTC